MELAVDILTVDFICFSGGRSSHGRICVLVEVRKRQLIVPCRLQFTTAKPVMYLLPRPDEIPGCAHGSSIQMVVVFCFN